MGFGRQLTFHDSPAAGVWSARIGPPGSVTLLSAAAAVPVSDAQTRLPSVGAAPFDLDACSAELVDGRCAVRIPLEADEKLYGLGLQMQSSSVRGGVFHLRMDHYSAGRERLHAPTPLYLSSRGYAVFFNTALPISLYMGVGNRLGDPRNPPARDRCTDPDWESQPAGAAVEASVRGNSLEVTVFAGPTMIDALRRYTLFCGGGALPPRWALGFWHRMPLDATADDVSMMVDAYDERGFPLDVIGLEPGWHSRSYPCSFEWSPERFPEPGKFLRGMAERGIRVNLWENPYVAEGSPLFEQLRPYLGSHTVWLGGVPDLTIPQAAKVIREHHRSRGADLGVSGYKIDEVDGTDNWLWPDHASFPSGVGGERMRQVYGVLWQREIERLFRQAGTRTFGLVRGTNGGATRFPFALYSDTYSHREYLAGLISTGPAGAMWCAEARSSASGEEWVRRIQTAVVSHVAQINAWADGTVPWSFEGFEEPVRSAMLFRIEIVPYLYTAFAQYRFEGTPVIRAMWLVDGGEESDQFMLGDTLLAAPMFGGERTRSVRLPAGRWYDYRTGAFAGAAEVIEIEPTLEEIPIYVREGALVPTARRELHAGALSAASEVIIRHYGDTPGTGLLYSDDGETFDYETGSFAWYRLNSADGAQGTLELIDGSWSGAQPSISWRHISRDRLT